MIRSRFILSNKNLYDVMLTTLVKKIPKTNNPCEIEMDKCLKKSYIFEYAFRYFYLHNQNNIQNLPPIPSPLKLNITTMSSFEQLLAESNFRLIHQIQKNPNKTLEYLKYLSIKPKINNKIFNTIINNSTITQKQRNIKEISLILQKPNKIEKKNRKKRIKYQTNKKENIIKINEKENIIQKQKDEIYDNKIIQNIFLSILERLNDEDNKNNIKKKEDKEIQKRKKYNKMK